MSIGAILTLLLGVATIRAQEDPATRQQLNQITSYIDASNVYGSSPDALVISRTSADVSTGSEVTGSCNESVALDVLIMLDHSSSIAQENVIIVRNAMKALVEQFTAVGDGDNTIKFALITYSKNVTVEFLFNHTASRTKAGTLAAIENMSTTRRRRSRADLAFKYANDVVFTTDAGDRPQVTNVLLHITDGRILKVKIQRKTLAAGAELNARKVIDKINVFLLKIPSTLPTSDVPVRDREFEGDGPTQPKDRYFKNFKDLKNLLPSIPEIAARMCAIES